MKEQREMEENHLEPLGHQTIHSTSTMIENDLPIMKMKRKQHFLQQMENIKILKKLIQDRKKKQYS